MRSRVDHCLFICERPPPKKLINELGKYKRQKPGRVGKAHQTNIKYLFYLCPHNVLCLIAVIVLRLAKAVWVCLLKLRAAVGQWLARMSVGLVVTYLDLNRTGIYEYCFNRPGVHMV